MSLILAIESAISGGSLSLLDGDTEIDRWIGDGNIARSEELLAKIDALIRSNDLSPARLARVAVSAGPGSFTGIRIGIATALGLKNGLGIPISSISALRAMVLASKGFDDRETVAAVPVRRDRVCFQCFRHTDHSVSELAEAETLSNDDFGVYLKERSDSRFLLHQALFDSHGHLDHVENFGSDLARAAGMACRLEPSSMTDPLFMSIGI